MIFAVLQHFRPDVHLSVGSIRTFGSAILCLPSVQKNFFFFISLVMQSSLDNSAYLLTTAICIMYSLVCVFQNHSSFSCCSFEHLAISKCHYMHVILNSLFSFPLFVILHAFCFDVVPVSYLDLILYKIILNCIKAKQHQFIHTCIFFQSATYSNFNSVWQSNNRHCIF